ncbi:unnamed protein product, partial [marine sediment metagenome]
MIKISNAIIPHKLADNKFILVKNTCYINNFTLRIFSNPKNTNGTNKNVFPVKNLNYELRSRSNKMTHTSAKIINLDGRISLDKPITPEEGNIDLQWTDENNNLIVIKIRFELTNEKKQAYDFELFFKEINEIFQKYRDLNESSKKQGKLDHFLRPHIIGVRNFISQLNTPIEISYELKKDQIKLFGYEECYMNQFGLCQRSSVSINIISECRSYDMMERAQFANKNGLLPKKIEEIFAELFWEFHNLNGLILNLELIRKVFNEPSKIFS